ncbi:MAG: ADP-ribosylglycohydrolase family protein [Planctomycetota bacterium]
MTGWDNARKLVDYEFTQSKEEGRDPEAVEALRKDFEAAGDDDGKLAAIWRKLVSVPVRDDFPFEEPSDLEGIRARRTGGPRREGLPYDEAQLYDRMYGAWLGRCAGCALGKPVEGMMGSKGDLKSWERIKRYLTAISPDEWPLKDYFPAHSPAEEEAGRVGCPLSTRENISFMESDDDIRYTVVGQIVMRDKGRDFETVDVARAWENHLPYGYVCTAETQAYRNLVTRYSRCLRKGEDVDWTWVAMNENPYREWIGAQIRVDSFAYAAPGDMELAAEFAWRDARLSHVKNGIYGEMLCGAMIAGAFVYDEALALVESALAEIPETSRLHKDIGDTIGICADHRFDAANFEAAIKDIYDLLGHYHAVQTNNYAALVAASLLLGQRDFEKVIAIAVMGGWDTDCNGATAGSIAGAMLGASALPEKWTAPLHDTLKSNIIDYHPIAISACARRSVEIARSVLG